MYITQNVQILAEETHAWNHHHDNHQKHNHEKSKNFSKKFSNINSEITDQV